MLIVKKKKRTLRSGKGVVNHCEEGGGILPGGWCIIVRKKKVCTMFKGEKCRIKEGLMKGNDRIMVLRGGGAIIED